MSSYRARRLVESPQRSLPQRPALYIGIAAAVVGVAVLLLAIDLLSPGAAPAPAATGPAASQSSIDEGPGGRVALTTWRLRADPSDSGQRSGWAGGRFGGTLVHVPNVANPRPVTGHAGVINFDGSVAWYRTAFDIPSTGNYALDFGSVNHLATVWLDGRLLGRHAGTYLPFEYRFHANSGRHSLVVKADWRNPVAQSAAGFHRTWFNFGGINREVSIRPVGASDLIAPDVRTQLVHTGSGLAARVTVTVAVRNYGATRAIAPGGNLSHAGQSFSLPFDRVRVKHDGIAIARAVVTVANPSLWEPGSPTLYQLTLNVGSEASYQANVGLRQLTWSHGLLYLNGRHLVLHGASIQEDARGHGDALTPADQDQLVSELQAIGANATRSQHPLDPSLLERLDAAGIMVWEGVGPVDPSGDWSSRTPPLMRLAKRRVRVSFEEAALHPSIIAWNLANEIAGNGHPGGQAEYVHAMTSFLHHADPGRLVAVDVWGEHPPKVAGSLYDGVDAVGETNYAGWYDAPMAGAAHTSALIHSRVDAMRRAFPDKVRIISEFGAEANGLNATSSPGGFDFQRRLIDEHVRIYAHDPSLSGMLVWDLRDFAVAPTFAGGSINNVVPGIRLVKGINQKGLFDYNQRAKPSVSGLDWLFRRLPAY